ncbi:unnamed protein product [Rhizopus stolonifer]
MFAYHRSSCYNTVIKRILKGRISSPSTTDLVLVNENSLQWYTVNQLPNTILSLELRQSTFGTILNGRQGIVLSEYGKMVFITIHNLSENVRRFETLLEVYLDTPGLEYTKKGRMLAIDPCSRAIAVASMQDRFDVFLLDTNGSRLHFNPISGTVSKIEKGIIWHMEFLYTESTSMERILLSLVVYNDEEKICRVIIYSIDALDINHITIERIGRLPMALDAPLPVLLIPLQFQPESLLLVTEQHANLLTSDDVACGNVLYPNSPIPREFSSIECPLFTSFAQHSNPNVNYLYLGSSDGYLFKLSVASSGELQWNFLDMVNTMGLSMCVLGTADLKHQENSVGTDILMYAGECADSQVISIPYNNIEERKAYKVIVLQDLVNRAPLRHTEIIPNFSGDQDALITCSGMGGQGFLNIITRGVEATMLASSKGQWKGITRLWNLDDLSCLLASSPIDSKLLISKDNQLRDVTLTTFEETYAETIYANTIHVKDTSLLLRVYSKGISILMLEGSNTLMITHYKDTHPGYLIEYATSWQDEQGTYIAICLLSKDDFILQILTVQDMSSEEDTDQILLSIDLVKNLSLKVCPSYIGYFHLNSTSFLFLGTFDASLLIYSIKEEDIQMVQEIHQKPSSYEELNIPHSIAIVYSSRTPDTPLRFLVGTHHGLLLSFRILPATSNKIISDEPPLIYNVGHLAVRLSSSCHRNDIAYALSSQLCQIRSNSDDTIRLEKVLLPQFNRPIDAFVSFDCGLDLSEESVAVVADGKLHVYILNQMGDINSRRIPLNQTPRKTIYFKEQNCIAVFTTVILSGTRKNYIRFIDAASGKFLTEPFSIGRDNVYAKNDTLLSVAEWSMECKGKDYQYICVGFGHSKESFNALRNGDPTESIIARGMLVLYRLKFHPKRGPTLKRVWLHEKLPGGILSMCPYSSKLLFSAKNHLYLYRFDLDTGRLVEVSHISLPNDIVSIHENNNRICITSQTDSISFYQFNTETNTFEFLKSDVDSLSAHHTLMLNSHTAICVSNSGGMIALTDDPKSPRVQKLFNFHHSEFLTSSTLALLGSPYNNETDILWKHLMAWEERSSGLQKPMVSCTVSGGILGIYRISQELYRVLGILQKLMLTFEATLPLLGSVRDFEDWYCQLSGTERAVIHGDLVEAYLRLSFDEQLKVLRPAGILSHDLVSAIHNLLNGSQDHLDNEPEEIKAHIIANVLINLLSGFSRNC